MSTVSEIWVRVNADVKGLQRGLATSATELRAFSATTNATAASSAAAGAKIGNSYGGVTGTIQKLGPVFIAAGALAVTGIVKGISATQKWASEVRTLQRVTGQSAADASRLATAGSTLGISTNQLATSFGLLGKNIINGSANLEKYGVVTKDASGATLPFNDILGNIADKFVSLPKGIEQATFAQNVFGRGGKALIPILAQGRSGLAALEAEADKYGTTLSEKDLAASRALTIAQKQLGEAFKGAEISLGRDFIPVLTSAVTKLTSVVEVIHAIPQPVLSAGLAFVSLAGGAAAAGKVVGFLKDGWTTFGNTLGLTTKVTETATVVMDENTAAVISNTAAQGSWGVEVNSATNSISTASDIIDAGTKATEASTTAVIGDTAAQAARGTVVQTTTGALVAQLQGQKALFDATLLGTGAVGDAAAAQGVLFTETEAATAAMEAQAAAARANALAQTAQKVAPLVPSGFNPFPLINSPIIAATVVVYGFVKSLQVARDEATGLFRVFAEHNSSATNVNQAIGAITKGVQLLGFAVPGASDNVKEFTTAVQAVQAGLQDGSVTFSAAKDKVAALAQQYGIDNLNVETFTTNLAAQVGVVDKAALAAEKHTRAVHAQGAAIGALAARSPTGAAIFDLMGTSAGQFSKDARAAFVESDQAFRTWAKDFKSQAVGAWQQFRDSAKTGITFSTSMLADLESAAKSAQATLAGDTSGLGSSQLAALRAQAHVTGQDILHVFQQAKAQTVSFSKDLLTIGKVGGQAGKDLAASFLAAGDVLSAQVVADAPKKLQEKIVGAFGASETAADRFSTKLTNAIVGPLSDISALLEAIARHFGIDVSFLDHGAQHKADALKTSLGAIAGRHRGEINLDTTQAMAALANLIAREHAAFSGQSGPVSVHQVHQGGLIKHAGGIGKRMRAGALAADEVPAILQRGEFVIRRSSVSKIGLPKLHELNRMHEGGAAEEGGAYGVRPIPTRNGQMWINWTPAIGQHAAPHAALQWWDNRLGGPYVREHASPTVHVAADLAPFRRNKFLAYTDFGLNHIAFNPEVKDTTGPKWAATWSMILKHEMGHAFGLSHVGDRSNLMYPNPPGQHIDAAQAKSIKKWFHPTMHEGGAVARMHAGGAVQPAFTPSAKNGQMWMWASPAARAADPRDARSFWNHGVGEHVVRGASDKGQSTVWVTVNDLPKRIAGEAYPYDHGKSHLELNSSIMKDGQLAYYTLLHEMGHAFGLNHVTSKFNIMYPYPEWPAINGAQVTKVKEHFHAPRIRRQLHEGGLAADEVPAVLQLGEFVMQKRAVQRIGVPALQAINRMHEGGTPHASGVLDWKSGHADVPAFHAGGNVGWNTAVPSVPMVHAGGVIDWRDSLPRRSFHAAASLSWGRQFHAGGELGSYAVSHPSGSVDWSYRRAPIAHAGGLLKWKDAYPVLMGGQLPSLPLVHIGGIVNWRYMFAERPLFHAGGVVDWSHTPDRSRPVERMHAGALAAGEFPAILQRGEFVIQRRAVQHIGVPALRAINRMHTGGPVDERAMPSAPAEMSVSALKAAFSEALRAEIPHSVGAALRVERQKLSIDRKRFGRDLDYAVMQDGHW